MRCRFLFSLLLVNYSMVCFSQIEINDSMSIGQNATGDIRMETIGKSDSVSGIISPIEYRSVYKPSVYPYSHYGLARSYDLQIPVLHFTPGQASLFHWNGGEIVATGGTGYLPGLMQIDSGELGIYQSIGNFTFYAGGMVNKYGYFRGLHTQYGVNGSITYQFAPRLSATIFGDYYFCRPPQMANGMPMPPSMIGYYGRSKYGGYVDYQINEYCGVQTGVHTVQQVGTNRYQAEPIVTPYYKVNKKVAIGLPVGQILYHILKK